ncbi:MAG: class E sortase [Methanobrevibacter sp.]|nr:class E sortase [Candidatus Methanovirga procula]
MKNRNIIILIIIFVMVAVFTTMMIFTGEGNSINESDINLKNYTYSELSFKYPETWQIKNSTKSSVIDKNYVDKLVNSNLGEISVNRQYLPSGYNIPKDFVPEEMNEAESNLKLKSSKKDKINGIEIYENDYTLKNNASTVVKELWVNKNNAVYSIILYGKNSNVMDIIKNNLKVDSKILNKNLVFGTVVIPKLDYNWNIRTDTVNAYSSVWHYNNSYYPGEKGSMGLLGHHTTYSKPFENLHKLVKGDKTYINDFLTQKRYTYEVASNDDIRYDYETNVIKFNKDDKELVMGTCWPPKYTSAERYCHSHLVNIDPLT